MATTATSVYLYYDQFDVLIYVGITKRGVTRNFEHNSTKEWWPFVTRQDVEHYETRIDAATREKALIQRHTPPFNRHHNVEHEAVKAAYLIFQHTQSLGQQSVIELLSAHQKRLVLDHHFIDGRMAFRTRLEVAPLASVLVLPDETPHPPVIGMRGKSGVTRVVEIEHRGPFAVLNTKRTRLHPISRGIAHVKFNTQIQRVVLRSLEVTMDHSDGDYCDKRCPPHLIGRARDEVA